MHKLTKNIYFIRSAETVGSLADQSQTVHETKEEYQGMGSIIGKQDFY